MDRKDHANQRSGNEPEHPPHLDKERQDRISRKFLDLPYANTSEAQKLDLYLPDEGDGPFPVIVHVHGGAFAVGDKADIQVEPWFSALRQGFAVASVNYRLSGEALFPAALIDLKAAVRWLKAHAGTYRLDADHLAACGGSAGGHLSLMLGLTANRPELEDLSLGWADHSCAVQAVVDWFGPTDFLQMDDQLRATGLGPCDHNEPDSPESKYLGMTITLIPERVALSNPLTYIHEAIPPLLIQHGDRDHLVPSGQSEIFYQAILQRNGSASVTFEILDGADHADPMFNTPENMDRVLRFLSQHLK